MSTIARVSDRAGRLKGIIMSNLRERLARIVCFCAIKVHFNDEGFADAWGCGSGLDCRNTGKCEERSDMLPMTTYWFTAKKLIEEFGK